MKKRILIILALVLVLSSPLMAASYSGAADKNTLGVGLNLGTNTGVGLRYGFGNFDLIGNFGFDLFMYNPMRLSGDVAVSYCVYTIDANGIKLPITVGGGVKMAITLGEKIGFNLGIVVPVGIEYTFEQVPINIYLRLAPGVRLVEDSSFKMGFDMSGYIGALWLFDL